MPHLCVQALSTREDQDRLAEMLFEGHSVPNVYLGRSDALSCLAAGKSTGMVVDSGGMSCSHF